MTFPLHQMMDNYYTKENCNLAGEEIDHTQQIQKEKNLGTKLQMSI